MTNPTLKQQLDAGLIVYVKNTHNAHVASAYREDPSYVFVGVTGRQELAVSCTDNARLHAHWNGFAAASIAALPPVCIGCGE